ncbi:MAG: hypothetical protein MZW92_52350 [Comamonadaceae bacterium]|nr:hypothetical protein [Comamonadaceae bacterium]
MSYADFITLLFAFFVVMYADLVGERGQVSRAVGFAGAGVPQRHRQLPAAPR